MGTEIRDEPNERILKPFLASLSSFLSGFQMGAMLGQPSVMLAQLQAEDSEISIDENIASWIASITLVGAPISSVLYGPLADRLGRKIVILMFFLLAAMGNATIWLAPNVTLLLFGRFWLGVASGFYVCVTVYVAEISPARQRSLFLSIGEFSTSVGLVYVYCVSGILTWSLTALISSCLSVIAIFLTFLIPESPAWLIQNHRPEDAVKSLKWLKGEDCDLTHELEVLSESYLKRPTEPSEPLHLPKVAVFKRFSILTYFAVLQSGTGAFIVSVYIVPLLKMFDSAFDPWMVSIGIAVVGTFASMTATYFRHRTPRKTLGMFSGFSVGSAYLVLYLYTHTFQEVTKGTALYSTVVAFCFILIVSFSFIGIYSLPPLMVCELYPLEIRGLMTGVSNCVLIVSMFVFIKLFYFFIDNLKLHRTILMFSLFSFGFGLFSCFVLPETHGKSLAEIEKELTGLEKKDGNPEA